VTPPRNPWHGIDAWRELKYDLRHPVLAVRGWKANVNNVGRGARRLCVGVMAVGGANVVVALVLLAKSYT